MSCISTVHCVLVAYCYFYFLPPAQQRFAIDQHYYSTIFNYIQAFRLRCHLTTTRVYSTPLAGNEKLHSYIYSKAYIFILQMHLKIYFLYCGWLLFFTSYIGIKRTVHRKQINIQLIFLCDFNLTFAYSCVENHRNKKLHLRNRNY